MISQRRLGQRTAAGCIRVTGHPAVLQCAVIAIRDDKWGDVVLAFVVCRPDTAIMLGELQSHYRTLIANYKIPRSVEVVSSQGWGETR